MPTRGTKPRYKVEGSGRQWYVWEWKPGKVVDQWVIIKGPYLTRRRANEELSQL